MADVIISPNMMMPVPIVGTDLGPDWANNINSCLSIVDGHDHSLGTGVQITPLGLNINSDLTFNTNNAILLRSVRFSPQGSALAGASDLGCLYEVGVDLYYNDGSGNQIRMTQSGSVAGASGTITGLPSGTASASYSAGTFTFQSATNVPATMDVGNIIIRNNTAGSNGVTISPVNSLAASYNLVLPLLPASQKIMTLDAAGNITAPYTVDNSSIVITSNVIKVGPQGVTAANIANGTITTTQISPTAGILGSQIATPGLSIGQTQVTFNTAGSTTWTVPANVTRVLVQACGGGGGGSTSAAPGSAGSDTLFNGVTIARGAPRGNPLPVTSPFFINTYSVPGGNGFNGTGSPGVAGNNSQFFNGGAAGPGTSAPGGGGGASDFANGSDGSFGGNGTNPGTLGSGSGGTNGGGGGYGALSSLSFQEVTPGASIPIVIGAGGAGGSNCGAGGDGVLVINY